MGLFGWSYPPGCSGPPDHDDTCMLCFTDPDRCACPVCSVCGEAGNPDCYVKHGLKKTFLQVDRSWVVEDQNLAQCEAEDRWAAQEAEALEQQERDFESWKG